MKSNAMLTTADLHQFPRSAVGVAASETTRLARRRQQPRTKSIEDIQQGDLVLAWDANVKSLVERRVTKLFRHHDRPILRVHLQQEDEKVAESIDCTLSHPFWVREKGWTAASQLKPGDALLAAQSRATIRVVGLSYPGSRCPVFNFEVEDAHNYFVGTTGVLVHNTSERPPTVRGMDGQDHGVGAYVSFERASGDTSRAAARITGMTLEGESMLVNVEIARKSRSLQRVVFEPITLGARQLATVRGSSTSERIFSEARQPVLEVQKYQGGALSPDILASWAHLPKPDLAARMIEALQIGEKDPLFKNEPYGRYLVKKGASVTITDAMSNVLDTYRNHPDLAVNPTGLLLHGSTSASLLSLTQNVTGLIPTGELLAMGKPPMAGELAYGVARGGVNNHSLSTVFITNPAIAERYAIDMPTSQKAWSPAQGHETIEMLKQVQASVPPDSMMGGMASARLNIEQQRLVYWDALSPDEQGLVTANYPVIWRMRPAVGRKVTWVDSSIPLEMAVRGGVGWNEVSEVRVPTAQVDSVKSMFGAKGIDVPVLTVENMMGRR